MRNRALALAAAALAALTVLGAAIAFAVPALAQDNEQEAERAERLERHEERLDELVERGVISAERAQEIRERMAERRARLEEKRAERAAHIEAIAETLNLTVDELRDARRDGVSLAELAEEAGVDPQVIIDQLVAAASERIEQALAAERIDEAQANERLAMVTERITAMVNGERPEPRDGGPGHGLRRGGFGPRPDFAPDPGELAERFRARFGDDFDPDDLPPRLRHRLGLDATEE